MFSNLKAKLNKLKILVLLQLSDKLKLKNYSTKLKKLALAGKSLLGMGAVYGIFVGLFVIFFKVFFIQASVNLFIFAILFMQLISIISCTTSMSSHLYNSRDNMLLLTYPVPHIYTYISKLLVSYILELIKSIFFVFPLIMAYATIVSGVISVNYIISGLIYSILLPLFPVLIGAILSIPVVYISKLLKKVPLLKILITILVFVGLVFLTRYIISILPEEIRLVALWNRFITSFNAFLVNFDKYALFYNFIGNAIYGNKAFLNDIFALLSLLGIGSVSILLSLPLFFKLASSVSENAVQKNHKSKNETHKSTFLTFMRKELKLSIRNISDFANNYLFLFIMPFALILMASIYVRINRNALGICMTYGFIGLISLMMLSASNTSSATAISSEGNEFVLLKTAPGKTSNIVWAKLLINFVISTIAVVISFALLSIFLKSYLDLGKLWIVCIYIILINFGLILWSIQIDVLNPKLKEYEIAQSRSAVNNGSTSIIIGLVVSLIFSVFLIVLFLLEKIKLVAVFLILLIIALIFVSIRLFFLINYVNAYFDDIQL